MPRDVFVSHSHEDHAFARRVCDHIEKDGFTCWIAPRDTPAGHFAGAIAREIRMCRVMVVVISRHSIASAHVMSEVAQAFKGMRTILPVRLDATPLSDDLEHYLVNAHQIEPGLDGEPGMFEELIFKLRQTLSEAPAAARTKTGPAAVPDPPPSPPPPPTPGGPAAPAPWPPVPAPPPMPKSRTGSAAVTSALNTPPLIPRPLTGAGEAKWPLIIGIISIVYGAIAVMCNIFFLSILPMTLEEDVLGAPGGLTVFHSLNAVADLILGAAFVTSGVLAIKRHPMTRKLHLISSWAMCPVLLVSGIYQGVDVAGAAPAGEDVLSFIGTMVAVLVFASYPIFLLVWFLGGRHTLPERRGEN
ncbi:MAG: toll/interleukin-1 receptor domain-containing protein [Phycisphaerales bacterium]|nr:toll/interleukin-1 receptor domain-containing protein [Phycisphaerales bacterium]